MATEGQTLDILRRELMGLADLFDVGFAGKGCVEDKSRSVSLSS